MSRMPSSKTQGGICNNFRFGARAALFGLATAVSLTAFASASHAYTNEQRVACTPDAFRLCSSEIPNIPGITACMRRLLVILNAMVKHQTRWQASPTPTTA